MNFVEPILRLGKLQPEAAALIDGDRTITYGELAVLVLRTAGQLASLGVRAEDRVGLCLKDTWEHLVTLLAVGRMGAVIVPIDWRARPAEKARVADALGIKLILVEPGSQSIIGCPNVMLDSSWHRAVALADPPPDLPSDWHAPFVILSTSGTTGAPKFMLATHLQYYVSRTLLELMSLPWRCRYLSAIPLCFSAGLRQCLVHLQHGNSIILYPPLVSAEEYIELVAKHKATVGYVVPTMIRQLLRLAEGRGFLLPNMDALICASAPIHAEEKIEAARKLTPNFFDYYGATAIGMIALLRPSDLPEWAASVGRSHPITELEIVDGQDLPLPSGAVGRLRCRGPTLSVGLDGPSGWERANESFHDGWYYPGDLAALGDRGYLFLKGRASDLIIRSGTKIHPIEIEAALQEHGDVLEAAVLGRRTADNDTEVVAFVMVRRPVEVGALMAHCRAHLTPYKVPREIRIVGELPKNASGKVNKVALRQQLDEQDWQQGRSDAPPGDDLIPANE